MNKIIKTLSMTCAFMSLGVTQAVYAGAACMIVNNTKEVLYVQKSAGEVVGFVSPGQRGWVMVDDLRIKVEGSPRGASFEIADTHESCVQGSWGWFIALGKEGKRVCATKNATADIYNTHSDLYVTGDERGYMALLHNEGADGIDYPGFYREAHVNF